MQLSQANVEYIFDYIEQLCGIALDDSKGYLIEARLNSLVKQHALSNAVELIDKAKSPLGESVRQSLVEAMTTRETFFFRDNSPFEALQFKALPELLDEKYKEKSNRIRIWSAAASTGQEACSIGIILHEMIPDLHRWDIQIIATDISEDALAKGRFGTYSKMEVDRGLPSQYVTKYFGVTKEGYKVVDSIHRMIRFQQLNLMHPFNFSYPFDIIFCRNVAIYFEKKVKIDLFRRMLPLLPKYGYMFVGVSESLFDCGPEFKPRYHCKSTFYQPHMPPPAPLGPVRGPAVAAPPIPAKPVAPVKPVASVKPTASAPIAPKPASAAAAPGFARTIPSTSSFATPATRVAPAPSTFSR
jgi:chemotaxis protein methyltransferase CheR